ncbi:MAG: hypothetical protein ACRELV_07550 [Longimicrobiales bacterium]
MMQQSSGRYDEVVRRLRQAVLAGAGITDVSMRAAVEARAAGDAAAPEVLPDLVRSFVDKVARHAYRVTDEDVATLRAAGYSEDAIFELAVSAAVGAGHSRLERGLSALRGEI